MTHNNFCWIMNLNTGRFLNVKCSAKCKLNTFPKLEAFQTRKCAGLSLKWRLISEGGSSATHSYISLHRLKDRFNFRSKKFLDVCQFKTQSRLVTALKKALCIGQNFILPLLKKLLGSIMSVWYITKSEKEEEKIWGLSNSTFHCPFKKLGPVLPYLLSSVLRRDSSNSPPTKIQYYGF